ncbi:class I adenylate-forming enzyme family protein [Variovorax sp. GT1P44]|uniref:class I adenylate-forming enzyme family protein n=1 Tax=Variovorax sp. GT1P44 TaxID=3443742 RepID=UPI003F45D0D1
MTLDIRLTISHWAAIPGGPLLDMSFGDLLRRLAQEVPERCGLVEVAEGAVPRRWSYVDLLASAERVARALLRRFTVGDRIAVWAPNCAEWILLQHGASLAGLVLVTVNPAYLKEELRHVLDASGAAGIFHCDAYRGTDMSEVVHQLRDELPQLREATAFSAWDAFVATSDPAIMLPEVQPTDTAQIQFTSGTTGKPKGARLHHRGLLNASRFAARRAEFPDGGVWATAMPLFHVGGCAGSQLGAMTSRGTFVLQTTFEPGRMLSIIESERVNHLHAVPAMVLKILEHPELPRRDVSSLHTLMSGGSQVPASLVERARRELGCRFTITFGQTELCGVVSQTYPGDSLDRQTSTIGQPAPWMEVKVADPDSGIPRQLGETGEIWARGYQVMHGYYNLTSDMDAAITTDGWLRTGDLACMDSAGYLRVTGRLKDCIIRGGENIYPREIEDALLIHPAVHEVSVVGLPDPQWGEIVAAALRLRTGMRPPTTLELHHHCRSRLAAYKTPAAWFYVDAFPTTPSGKVQKFALKEQIKTGALTPQPFEKPERAKAA